MAANDTIGMLSDAGHDAMDALLGGVLDDYKDGLVGRADVIAGLAQFITAVDHAEGCEIEAWLRDGRIYIQSYAARRARKAAGDAPPRTPS